jgi:hypothetical protein
VPRAQVEAEVAGAGKAAPRLTWRGRIAEVGPVSGCPFGQPVAQIVRLVIDPILMVADRRMQPGLQGAPEPIKEGLEVAELTALVLDISQQEHGVWIQGRCQTGHAVITAGGIRGVLATGDVPNGGHHDTRCGPRRSSGGVLAHGRIRGPAPGIAGLSGDKRGFLG